MKRTMFQLYLKGCNEAIEFYMKAFDATLLSIERIPENNMIYHAEINAFGQIISFCEMETKRTAGNTMQFCFHFDDGSEEIIKKAYDVLKENAQIIRHPLGSWDFSDYVTDLTDKFGVHWCLFI